MFTVLLLTLKVKFDLRGQRSFKEKVKKLRAQIISDMTSKMKISVTILEILEFQVFLALKVKFDLRGQRSVEEPVTLLIITE